MESEMLRLEEAARMCRISRTSAYRAVRRGDIPCVRIGRLIRVSRSALNDFLKGDRAPREAR